ncbi:transglycosylase protein with SLT domain [Saccharopolyspora erythraea NRRL 2338]|uniref:Membrane-bound lytic murein transglycosylase B n=1 Tax=Saccharopolyspora erythraea TaxID=1836 RepID=A0ABP3NQQ9_SACER|nr:transglycosylase protein with SLT domain [Saccharopolyspora erythraea NRRL 2338]QRK92039.1 lytic transglycosylase domain-containing protein [Saccharopolyspora erythraea]
MAYPWGSPRRRGERFTAVVTGLLFAFGPLLALRGDAVVQSATDDSALPDVLAARDHFGGTGRLPADLIPDFALFEEPTGRGLNSEAAEPAPGPTGRLGIPGVVLDAYRQAEQTLTRSNPRCGLQWPVLAGIGRIESGHARSGRVDARGTTTSPILGPRLDGAPGVAAIPDTDAGALDSDPVWDRAVGPMQFIPSTWRRHAADGNADGIRSPHNVFDAALASGRYLCAGGGDLRERDQLAAAVFRYNHSDGYVRAVLGFADAYARGVVPTRVVLDVVPAPPPQLPPPPPGTPPPPVPVPPPGTVPPPPPTTEPPPTTPPPTTEPPPPPTTSGPPPPSTSTPPPTSSSNPTSPSPTPSITDTSAPATH